MESNRSKN